MAGLQLASSDIERFDASSVPAGDIEMVANADTDLGFRILAEVAEGENVVLSPSSIATALGMLLPGTRGQTADEVAELLGAEDQTAYHAARNALDVSVTAVGEVIGEGNAQPFTLRSVNALFGQDGFDIESDYLDILAINYGAGMNLVDFQTKTEEARVSINDWVEDQTEDRIEDLIPPGVVTDLTRLVLVNAVYFKANWENQFDPANTAAGTFLTPSGEVTADMMQGSIRAPYVQGADYVAIKLSYVGWRNSMLIVMPTNSFEGFTMDSAVLTEIRTGLSDHQVDFSMPKFEFTTDIGLKPVLSALGMKTAFVPPGPDSGANLTGIHQERLLYVQDALHKAFIAVDEVGTEAAAATAIVIGLESAPPPAELKIDRPFLFVIQDDATGEAIFLGQVTNPTS